MALFLFFTKISIFFTYSEHYTADTKMNFISLPKIRMKKKIEMIQEQEYRDTSVHTLEEWIQYEKLEKELAQTLQNREETTIKDVDSIDDGDIDGGIDELTESLKSKEESEEPEKSEWLDLEKMTRKLEWALCYAYDVYLRVKEDGEHCPTISIGDYVFAARGFTCGHVDQVKIFKKTDKKVLFVFKKKEYVPVEVTMDIVNILAEAGGVLPPLDDETLLKM